MSHSLTLLQWNTWYKENPENIISFIQEVGPDIACLQELTQNSESTNYRDVPRFIAEALGYEYHFSPAQYWPSERGKKVQGNGIFSKFPIVSSQSIYLQKMNESHFEDYTLEGRVLALAQVEIKGSLLNVGTTHLSYTHRFQETDSKLAEEEKLLDALALFNKRFIVAGDLNVDENSHLVKKLEQRFMNAAPDYRQKTWTTKPFTYNGFEETELKWRLDHIFATKDVKAISSRVIPTDYSDHLPVLSEISIFD